MNKHQHSGEKLKNWLEQNKLQEEHYGQYIAGIDPVKEDDKDYTEVLIEDSPGVYMWQKFKATPAVEEKVPWWKALYRKYMKG